MKTKALLLLLLLSFCSGTYAENPQLLDTASQVSASSIPNQDFEKSVSTEVLPITITSHLKKLYDGYKIVITSNYPGTLNIDAAIINNGVAGATAYKTLYVSPYKALPWAFIPFIGIIPALTLDVMYGTTDAKMEKESKLYPGTFSGAQLKNGESVAAMVLVPAGQKPIMNLKFSDKENNQVYSLIRL